MHLSAMAMLMSRAGLVVSLTLSAVTGVTPDARRGPIQYWDLPTGSHVAYIHYAAQAPTKATPIIFFLHGGPGAFIVDHSAAAEHFYRSLTTLGFDVYLYDQIGSGHSARLSDPRQYTVERHISDLEAIRQRLLARRVILIGDSWGAALAAKYIAEHPDSCAKAFFPDQARWIGVTLRRQPMRTFPW